MTFLERLTLLLNTNAQLIGLQFVRDEGFMQRSVQEVADYQAAHVPEFKGDFQLNVWDPSRGASWISPSNAFEFNRLKEDPYQVIADIGGIPHPGKDPKAMVDPVFQAKDDRGHWKDVSGRGIFLLFDCDAYLAALPACRRRLKELVKNNQLGPKGRHIVVVTEQGLPSDLIEFSSTLKLPVPNYQQLREETVDFTIDSLRATKAIPEDYDVNNDMRDKLTRSIQGLGIEEGQQLLREAWSQTGPEITDAMLDPIASRKAMVIESVEGLQFHAYDDIKTENQIEGWGEFKQWIRRKVLVDTPEARRVKLKPALGCVLVGPAGTGKTTVAKIIARYFHRSLLEAQLDQLFGSKLGETERNANILFNMIQSFPEIVILLDELQEVVAYANQTQRNDGGARAGVVRKLKTFLSERPTGPDAQRMFVVATMNRTTGVPVELFRSGRFNRMWKTDLPKAPERIAIAKLHMELEGIDPNALSEAEWQQLGAETDDFAPADLEQMVQASRELAWLPKYQEYDEARKAGESRPEPVIADTVPTIDDMLDARFEITLASRMDEQERKDLDDFCDRIGAKSVHYAATSVVPVETRQPAVARVGDN
jgi:SpoVK/Ycf46/Vps4 family AAA+-type ATPase